MATNKPRYTVSVDDEMFKAIEDFRFENCFQTRSEATVELIRLGLEQLKKKNSKRRNRSLMRMATADMELPFHLIIRRTLSNNQDFALFSNPSPIKKAARTTLCIRTAPTFYKLCGYSPPTTCKIWQNEVSCLYAIVAY